MSAVSANGLQNFRNLRGPEVRSRAGGWGPQGKEWPQPLLVTEGLKRVSSSPLGVTGAGESTAGKP